MRRILLVGLAAWGCHGSSPKPSDTPNRDSAVADTMSLSSTAFTDGAAIPAIHTCQGKDLSPQLAWTGAPPGTQSFAVVLTDLSLTPNLVHWVLYDLPAAATSLPEGVDKAFAPANVSGAHQTTGYDGQTRGYLGPCPPSKHSYQFTVHALDAPTLPGATMQTSAGDAMVLITAHQLARGALTGTFGP